MYFPYFRGRQYELLALKELAQNGLLSNKIIPVIEPIKISSTFKSTLKTYEDDDKELALIVNPQFGDLIDDGYSIIEYIGKNVIPSIILKNDAATALLKLENNDYTNDKLLVVLDNEDCICEFSFDVLCAKGFCCTCCRCPSRNTLGDCQCCVDVEHYCSYCGKYIGIRNSCIEICPPCCRCCC